MLIRKEVSDKGKIEITINGQSLDSNLSRELTGTTSEEKSGVFYAEALSVGFHFGAFYREIVFSGTYSITWQMEDLVPAISARIKKVREWVQDCKDSGGVVQDG